MRFIHIRNSVEIVFSFRLFVLRAKHIEMICLANIYTIYTCYTYIERICRAYTPVITDITLNPFVLLREFPPFFHSISIIRSKCITHTHLHCSRLVWSNTDITWTQFFLFVYSFSKQFSQFFFLCLHFTFVKWLLWLKIQSNMNVDN